MANVRICTDYLEDDTTRIVLKIWEDDERWHALALTPEQYAELVAGAAKNRGQLYQAIRDIDAESWYKTIGSGGKKALFTTLVEHGG